MRLILIFTFLILTCRTFTQTVDYFADNPMWRQSSSCAIPWPCILDEDFVYYIKGDSIIDSKLYKVLFKRGNGIYNWMSSPPDYFCNGTFQYNGFAALLRQDSLKIFIWDTSYNMDTLLYNFDLHVGDTLPLTYNNSWTDIFVGSIDSILIGDTYRRKFNLQGSGGSFLIEGVGHDEGLLEPFPPYFECGYNLNCFALNDTVFYPSYNFPCDLTASINDTKSQESIKVIANQNDNTIVIKMANPSDIISIDLFDFIGKQVKFRRTNIDGQDILIDISDLNSGLYLLTVITKDLKKVDVKLLCY